MTLPDQEIGLTRKKTRERGIGRTVAEGVGSEEDAEPYTLHATRNTLHPEPRTPDLGSSSQRWQRRRRSCLAAFPTQKSAQNTVAAAVARQQASSRELENG